MQPTISRLSTVSQDTGPLHHTARREAGGLHYSQKLFPRLGNSARRGAPTWIYPAEQTPESGRLPGKDSLIPGAESLAFTFRVIAASLLSQPSLVQKLCTQLAQRSVLFDFDVTEKAEAFADGTSRAEFARR